MKFKYLGDCEGFSFRGLKFPIGQAVEVVDPEVIKKLENNSHFKAVKTNRKKAANNGNTGRDTKQSSI